MYVKRFHNSRFKQVDQSAKKRQINNKWLLVSKVFKHYHKVHFCSKMEKHFFLNGSLENCSETMCLYLQSER